VVVVVSTGAAVVVSFGVVVVSTGAAVVVSFGVVVVVSLGVDCAPQPAVSSIAAAIAIAVSFFT
jgi:hypothetical protein